MKLKNRYFFWKLLAVCGLLLLATEAVFAQQVVLSGRVLDAKTALPVAGVNIVLEVPVKLPFLTRKVVFFIKTDTVFGGQNLIFSHVGYEKNTVKLRAGQRDIQVKLMSKTNTLSEVKITASRKLKPVKVGPEIVLDFAITHDRLFVLGWESGLENPTLQVLNLYNDSLLMNCRLPVYAEKLYVDCLNNLHLLTENHVYQVLVDSVSLALYPPELKAAFEQQLRPCLVTDDKNAYFRRNINNRIIVSFYAVNQQTHETKLFRTVADEAVLTMQQSEARFQFFRNQEDSFPISTRPVYTVPEGAKLRYEGPTAITMTIAGMKARFYRGVARNMNFAQLIMFQGPYVPLLKVGKQICLFDHVNGKVEFYESDSLQRVLPVNYHLQANWDKQIVIDKVQENAYVLFRKNGLPELKLLNLETGKLMNSYKLDNAFAENIAVHHGQVYFLYKDPAKSNRQFLYKAPLNLLQN